MSILSEVKLTDSQRAATERAIGLLAANGGIDLELVREQPNAVGSLVISVTHARLTNGILWTQSELVSRAAGALRCLAAEGYRIDFRARVFEPDLSPIDGEWIFQNMQSLGLKQRDLCKQLGLDKATLSEFLSGRKSLTKIHRAMFWHYFQLYKVSRGFLEYMSLED